MTAEEKAFTADLDDEGMRIYLRGVQDGRRKGRWQGYWILTVYYVALWAFVWSWLR